MYTGQMPFGGGLSGIVYLLVAVFVGLAAFSAKAWRKVF